MIYPTDARKYMVVPWRNFLGTNLLEFTPNLKPDPGFVRTKSRSLA